MGMICDASYSTFMLTHWARDRTRGRKLPLAGVRDFSMGGNMSNFRVINADAHFVEPPEVWTKFLDPQFQWAAPKRMVDNQGRMRRVLAGQMLHHTPYKPKSTPMEKLQGSWDPKARLADMDRVGVDGMAIYPTWGLFFFSLTDPATCAALCRAYNDWASEFVATDPKRLFAPAIVPQIDVQMSIAEAKRGLRELGLKGVFMRPNLVGGRTIDHPSYESL